MEIYKTADNTSIVKKILIAAPLHQQIDIFEEFQNHLDNLIIPGGYCVDRFYVVNNCPEIIPHIRNAQYVIYDWGTSLAYHSWNEYVIKQMSYMRNICMDVARANNYDYLFFVDTDLVLNEYTLVYLLNSGKDIVYEKHLTQNPDGGVWCSVYECDDGKYRTQENLERYRDSHGELFKVGGGVGCVLISRNVLDNKNVNYSDIENLRFGFIWGEDKYFAIRAYVNGFEIWADSNVPCVHLFSRHAIERWRNGLDPIDWTWTGDSDKAETVEDEQNDKE